jgi:hypothetical protein
MNLGHAAGLTLMGWYLIVPPYVRPYRDSDLRAPLSQWKIVERFDTATACKDYLQETEDDPEFEGLEKVRKMGIAPVALNVARCIFSDVRTSNEK